VVFNHFGFDHPGESEEATSEADDVDNGTAEMNQDEGREEPESWHREQVTRSCLLDQGKVLTSTSCRIILHKPVLRILER